MTQADTGRAAVYARVSSEEQRDGHSLDEQVRLCREFCAKRGARVVAEFVEVESAKNVDDRPKFQAMIEAAQAGDFGLIVCHKLDRFSRDVVDGLTTLKDLARYGVTFATAAGDFDFTTPMGELMLTLDLSMSRWYRRNLITEVTKGKQGRARAGLSNAPVPPFGYQRVDGRDVPSADADAARSAFERYATDCYTDMDIALWLNALGKTTTGTRGRRPFSKETVRAMLMNPFYAGFVAYRGLEDRENERRERMRRKKRDVTLIRGQHEALISEELFERCKELRAARGHNMAGRKPTEGRCYILTRYAHCATCGGRLRSTRFANTEGYRCTARERAVPCAAAHPYVPQSALLPDLADIMGRLRLPDEVKAQAAALIAGDDQAAAIERKRESLRGELARLNRMYQAGTVTDAYFDNEARRIQAELATLASAERAGQGDVGAAIAALEDMAQLWRIATPEEQADIVASVFERIDVDLDARRIVAFEPKNEYRPLFRAVFNNGGSDGYRFTHLSAILGGKHGIPDPSNPRNPRNPDSSDKSENPRPPA